MKKNMLNHQDLTVQERLMFANIRLELLRFAIGVNPGGTIASILDTAKQFDGYCFIEDETVIVQLPEPRGEA